ncbi:tyrosine-type recombinase/integrase [Hymenobacter crusticola]|uniref:Tyr recombinase domain-containing protein n=1 Tax=Hymenobacter crusticola TaxID=1770526 RepID=A0A243W664_9BACT|nr:tyrosine-type recombinase/integrase [Hymenobacter crusticola]OUJ69483.1 hypothetical protein BXP70_26220 [Hymenobacter crusticola]
MTMQAVTWKWNSSLLQFQRDKALSSREKTSLAKWIEYPPTEPLRRVAARGFDLQGLERLVHPIKNAFSFYNYNDPGEKYSFACCALLIKEMHERQTSFWSWSKEIWLEIVCTDQAEFTRRYGKFQAERGVSSMQLRPYIIALVYLLGEIPIHHLASNCQSAIVVAARRIFGDDEIENAIIKIRAELKRVGKTEENISGIRTCICMALLLNRQPTLEQLTPSILKQVSIKSLEFKRLKYACDLVLQALYNLKIPSFEGSIQQDTPVERARVDDTVSANWILLIEQYIEQSDALATTKAQYRGHLEKAARWAASTYPATAEPHQWTPQMARSFRNEVINMRSGQWGNPNRSRAKNFGKPLKPASQLAIVNTIGHFLAFCQDNIYINQKFNFNNSLELPKHILRLIETDPRVIQKEIWEKLVTAAASLTEQDLLGFKDYPGGGKQGRRKKMISYPLSMVRALADLWVHSGMRSDEIRRLEVGCVRLISAEFKEKNDSLPVPVCMICVPDNKSGASFEKPVHSIYKNVIIWQKYRPSTDKQEDYLSKRLVNYLFSYNGRLISKGYLNKVLIPLLCRKAGVSEYDFKGRITSHRARATVATELYERGMNLLEISKWLGHKSLQSTMSYVKIGARNLTDALIRASHKPVFNRNDEIIIERILSNLQIKPLLVESPKVIVESGNTTSLRNLKFCVKKPACVYKSIAHNALLRAQKNRLISEDRRQIIDLTIAVLALFDTFD